MTGRALDAWTALAIGLLIAAPLGAQVVRLPTVMPPSEPYPATKSSPVSPTVFNTMMARPDSPAELPPTQMPRPLGEPAPDEIEGPTRNPDLPADARDGMFQKLIFTHEWLTGGGGDELGVHDLELETILALPIPSRSWPLLITPGFAVHFLNGPTAPDLPPRVYDAYTQFRSLGRINPRLGAEMAVTLGEYSDFEQNAGEAFRITGHGAAMWEWTPTAKIVLGAAYINTYDTDVIPIGGLIWKPNADLDVEAVFPSPKIARRVYWRGACTDEVQDWLYLAGEFGNDTWAIRRAAGFDDEVNYRDWRVLLGLERRAIGRLDYRIEVGYVFSRRLHYQSMAPSFPLSDTFLLRSGWTY